MFAPSDYHFELPPELIAQEATVERAASRLLHVTAAGLDDLSFAEVVELLPANAVVVVNDTRVIPARVVTRKPTGGVIELLFLEPEPGFAAPVGLTAWRCLARGTIRVGLELVVDHSRSPRAIDDAGDTRIAILTARAPDASIIVGIVGDGLAFLDRHGHIPLPHYIDREDRADDRARYQTMFARVPGAVAAPTAGLHITPAIVERLTARGMTIAPVTLHVGWGTFESIRATDVREHRMHRERYQIPDATAALVASDRPVVAIGTTALRALESAARATGSVSPGEGETDLFVYPGSHHTFRAVDHLVTNFHLPESTLLMLVCAFAGTDRVRAAYRHAVVARYRFFSYGDAMLVHRNPEP